MRKRQILYTETERQKARVRNRQNKRHRAGQDSEDLYKGYSVCSQGEYETQGKSANVLDLAIR